jgi:hypothetical protein
MLDALQDWLSGIALAITSAIGAFLVHLSRGQQKHSERMAVLEHQASQVPELLSEIRDEVKLMRQDGERRQERIFEQIENVRLELKSDIANAGSN